MRVVLTISKILTAHLKLFKNDKNAYFISKALFILKIFKFLPWLFDHLEKIARLES